MKRKIVFIGIAFIVIGAWIYTALSSFGVEDKSFPKRLIINEGTVRTEVEVAEALAKEMDFDLEGAYKTGYTPMDVANYLMQVPHTLSITFYDGKFYHGRRTVPYFIPLSICILLISIGVIMILSGIKAKKS
jgi:hypothetical protein